MGGLARVLPEREFQAWQGYAARWMLPQRRMEMYLAQIALLIAQTMGEARDSKLSDFLFDPEPDQPESQASDLESAVEFFGFSPRKD